MTDSEIAIEQVKAASSAWEAGEAWAKNLKAGDTFLGCMPEANTHYKDELCRSMFISASYRTLKSRIICTAIDSNIITKAA